MWLNLYALSQLLLVTYTNYWWKCFEYVWNSWLKVLFADAKRLIGRRFDDATVQADMKHWPFEVVNEDGKPKIRVQYKGDNKTFYPEEVSTICTSFYYIFYFFIV